MSSDRARLLLALGLGALAACAPSGGSDELAATLDRVEPACGDTVKPTAVVLRGSFPALPRVSLSGGAELDTTYRVWVGDFLLRDVTWRDASTIAATVPASIPAGVYALTLESPFHDRASLPGFEIRPGGCAGTPGALALTAQVAPNAVTVGQRVTVTATARNTGAQTLFDVDAAVSSAPAGVTLVSSQTGARTLAGGASTTYTWIYSTAEVIPAPGATFAVAAAGKDGLGRSVAAAPAVTSAFLVSPPANVTAHTHAPESVNVGQTFTFTLDAANTGSAPASVSAEVVSSATGGATVTRLSSPTAQQVPAGGERSFVWTFSASGPCTVTLSVAVTATDLNSGQALTVAPTPPTAIKVQRPATLATTVDAAPATVASGGTVIVTATVQNGGEATVSNAAPTATAPALFTRLTGPGAPQSILGGLAGSFTWTFRAEAGATRGTFAVDAAGLDANTSTTITAPRAVSVEVAAAYPVGGNVSGLGGGTVVLRNGSEDLPRSSDGAFVFVNPVASGAAYAVSVGTQPAGRTCAVANGSGTVGGAPVGNVAVTCTPVARTLVALVSPPGAGTLACNGGTCQPSYSDGTVVLITQTPAAGHTFREWSGDCTGTGTCSVNMTANRSVTASYDAVTPALTLAVSPPGGGALACNGGACQATYAYDTVVQITQTPAAGYTFREWSGDCTGAGPCSVRMTASRSVTASYDAVTPALTVRASPAEGGTLSCDGGACQPTYPWGAVVQITQTPAAGYAFRDWSGACTGTAPTCTVTMTANRTVTANYDAVTPALTVGVSPGGAGTLECNGAGCKATYAFGTIVTVTQTPRAGYTFREWTGDCTGAGACSVTMTADRSVTAAYDAITPALTVAASPPGGGALACDGGTCQATYAYGTVVSITQTPNPGFTFREWTGACTGTGGTCRVTMTADRAVTASYDAVTPALTVTASPSGGGELACNGDACQPTYAYGTVVTITQTPSPGYAFQEWTGACTGAGSCEVTMTADRAVTAQFVASP